jgi:hypothetical protein
MLATLVLLLVQDPNALVGRLGADSIEAREQATIELRAMGLRASDTLLKAARHSDAEVSARALALLAGMLDQLLPERTDHVPALAAERDRRRFEAAFATVTVSTPPKAGARETLLAHPDWVKLASLGPRAVPRLVAKLDSAHALHAVLGLGLFDDPRAAKALDLEVERNQVVAHGDPST